jgi:site-specific DNA-cytosine methylase
MRACFAAWPADVTDRQMYRLLGNSINVNVAARLVHNLLDKSSYLLVQ